MMGRPPIPTHLKVIRGNPGKRPLNKQEPKPAGNLKEPPQHFDDELRAVWEYAIENSPVGLLKKIDSSVLETWCTAHVLHRRALAEVRKFGMLVKPPKSDVPVQSPYLPIVNKQALIMMRAIDHLGFSPASRTRIMMGDVPLSTSGGWGDIESAV
jgi:P27 family predicted phage terminase small subunit